MSTKIIAMETIDETLFPFQLPERFDEISFAEASVRLNERALRSGIANTRHVVESGRIYIGSQAILLIKGDPELIAQTKPRSLKAIVAPPPEHAWRSEASALSPDGKRASAELVSAPGTASSSAGGPCDAATGGSRTAALCRLGEADRQICARARTDFSRTVIARTGSHCNESGFLNLSESIRLFRSVETLLPIRKAWAPKQKQRRLHVFETIEPGASLQVSAELVLGMPQAPHSMSMRSWVKRHADGAIIAFCDRVLT
ncbi:MAG: hypothetical protein AAF667_09905 [Pseudomonadota bacterium]